MLDIVVYLILLLDLPFSKPAWRPGWFSASPNSWIREEVLGLEGMGVGVRLGYIWARVVAAKDES